MYKFDSNIYELLTETSIINNFYEKRLYKNLTDKKRPKREVIDDSLSYFVGKALSLGMIDKGKQIYYKDRAYYLFTEMEVRSRPLDFELVGGNYVSHYLSKNIKHTGPKHLKFGENRLFFTSLNPYIGIMIGILAIIAILLSLGLSAIKKTEIISNTSSIVQLESKTIASIDNLFTDSSRRKLKESISSGNIEKARKELAESRLSTKQKEREEETLVDVSQYLSITKDIKEVEVDNVEALQVILQDIDRIRNVHLRSQLQGELNSLLVESELKTTIQGKLYDYSLTETELTSLKETINSLSNERLQEFKKEALSVLNERMGEVTAQSTVTLQSTHNGAINSDTSNVTTTDPSLYQIPNQSYIPENTYQTNPNTTYSSIGVETYPSQTTENYLYP